MACSHVTQGVKASENFIHESNGTINGTKSERNVAKTAGRRLIVSGTLGLKGRACVMEVGDQALGERMQHTGTIDGDGAIFAPNIYPGLEDRSYASWMLDAQDTELCTDHMANDKTFQPTQPESQGLHPLFTPRDRTQQGVENLPT